MKGPRIHLKHLIDLTIVVLTSLLTLSGYLWNRPQSHLADKAHSSNRSNKPVRSFTTLQHDQRSEAQVSEAYGKLPLSFEANCGQTNPAVKFISAGQRLQPLFDPHRFCCWHEIQRRVRSRYGR